MRKVTLFIAVSLDGYIADSKGKVDWLEGQDENVESPDIYGEFVKDIDTVIMGRNTIFYRSKSNRSGEKIKRRGRERYLDLRRR